MKSNDIEIQRISYLYEGLPSGLVAIFSILLIIGYNINEVIESSILFTWLGLNMTLLFLRTLSFVYYKKIGLNADNSSKFYLLFFSLAVISAFLMGSGSYYIFPDTLSHQMIILFMLISLTAGAAVSLASKIEIFYIYIIFILSPYLYIYLISNVDELNTLALVLFIYIIILLTLSKKISKNINSNIVLAYENKELVTQLKDKVQEANLANSIKSKFLANMSHELRTPLNAIIGFSQVLQRNKTIDFKPKLYIDKINSSGNKLLQLINSILDFSKIEAGEVKLEKKEFNLYATLKNIIDQFELEVQDKNIDIILDYPSSISRSYNGDSLRVSQILTNLLTNAIKFTEKGSVTITIRSICKDRVRFEVRDTGIGLSKEQQNKLFKPFSQADDSITRNYGGTGLGLSISKELVELMNGNILIDSEIGVGSSFIFEIELQACETTIVENNQVLKDINIALLKDKNILLVEDNKTNQLVLISLLEDSGVNIDIANNGKEAVEKFKLNKYNIILMDLQMPVMDGYEAAKIIRNLDINIPIIALTANVMDSDVEKTKAMGMNGHINKPVKIDYLYSVLLKYI